MNNLPSDWKELPIRDVTVRATQRDPRRQPTMRFRYVDVSSVSNSSFRIVEATDIEGSAAPSRARKEICAGDVLFATVRPTLKRVALVPSELDGQIASTGFIVLRADPEKLNASYLYNRLLTDAFIKRMGELERGASYPAVRDGDVLDEVIPVPPLAEQRKIAGVLGLVQRALEQQERLIALTTELKKAVLHQLFTQGLRGEPQKQTEIGPVPQSWEVVRLGDVAKLQSGGTPARNKPEYWTAGDIPWVKTGEIDYRVIRTAEERITREGLANSAAKVFPKGTLLIAMYGQGVTRGRVGLLGIDAATNQACAAITPLDEQKVSTQFIYHFLEFHYEDLRQMGHGANQRNLNAALIKGFRVSFPNPDEQARIVEALGILDKKLALHQSKHTVLTALFRTLLHQLMTAQLRVHNLELRTEQI
jgi:type I restriction enzyme S subunit